MQPNPLLNKFHSQGFIWSYGLRAKLRIIKGTSTAY
jgi:hypothetical protein